VKTTSVFIKIKAPVSENNAKLTKDVQMLEVAMMTYDFISKETCT